VKVRDEDRERGVTDDWPDGPAVGQQRAVDGCRPPNTAALPCPWCRTGEPRLPLPRAKSVGETSWTGKRWVSCACGAKGPRCDSDVAAVAAWNRVCRLAERGAEVQGATDSPTWPYVLAFARLMEAKLAANRHKGDRAGWLAMSPLDLMARAQGELGELMASLANWHHAELHPKAYDKHEREIFRQAVLAECPDAPNFAMMIADVCGGLAPAEVPHV